MSTRTKRQDRAVLLALRLLANDTGHHAEASLRDLATAAGVTAKAVLLSIHRMHRADVIRMAHMRDNPGEPSLILLDRRRFPPAWRNCRGEVC